MELSILLHVVLHDVVLHYLFLDLFFLFIVIEYVPLPRLAQVRRSLLWWFGLLLSRLLLLLLLSDDRLWLLLGLLSLGRCGGLVSNAWGGLLCQLPKHLDQQRHLRGALILEAGLAGELFSRKALLVLKGSLG